MSSETIDRTAALRLQLRMNAQGAFRVEHVQMTDGGGTRSVGLSPGLPVRRAFSSDLAETLEGILVPLENGTPSHDPDPERGTATCDAQAPSARRLSEQLSSTKMPDAAQVNVTPFMSLADALSAATDQISRATVAARAAARIAMIERHATDLEQQALLLRSYLQGCQADARGQDLVNQLRYHSA